jgi:hypothetical protein
MPQSLRYSSPPSTESRTQQSLTDAAMAECVRLNKGPFPFEGIALFDHLFDRMKGHMNKKLICCAHCKVGRQPHARTYSGCPPKSGHSSVSIRHFIVSRQSTNSPATCNASTAVECTKTGEEHLHIFCANLDLVPNFCTKFMRQSSGLSFVDRFGRASLALSPEIQAQMKA